ncbi:glucuronate isomerase [Alkalihalobacillus oceani]|uniref:glucuronate isomerase n=1 Tax=Halalkalibacter oceani TaxID=1653776 RepID=UPI00203CFD7E|nr:glucuronate isomerase [Halalkalibacter oceani]MCM3759960.1 glucuronate isomerase [Halalkalibacter oceani]
MKRFINEDFLLETDTAKRLYHDVAKEMPIFDYHCHLSAQDIAENKQFQTITEAWLSDDHYKWRAMRAHGVEEAYITGEKDEREKFQKWAETVPHLIGNPLYHWTHLELRRCFGMEEILTPANAELIWGTCNELLQKPSFSARELIQKFNVKALCTTDNPVDSLEYHKQLKEDRSFKVSVLPTFRPDEALQFELAGFVDWLHRLEAVTDREITTYDDFIAALETRVAYFHDVGCRLSDHGLDQPFFQQATEQEVGQLFQKRMEGRQLTAEEALKLRTATLLALGKMYAKKGWAMQFHIGALRRTNTKMQRMAGAHAGFDSIADFTYAEDLARLLDTLDQTDELPKTILYNLNPRDHYMVASMAGNFQGGRPGKVQFGTAWWFNDQRDGMEEQMKVLANVGVFSNFVGMLTDSRSFLSYTRHEYFRRILCNLIGNWVENGEYPEDYEFLGELVENICFHNIHSYLLEAH